MELWRRCAAHGKNLLQVIAEENASPEQGMLGSDASIAISLIRTRDYARTAVNQDLVNLAPNRPGEHDGGNWRGWPGICCMRPLGMGGRLL